jgi:hypothetical protein
MPIYNIKVQLAGRDGNAFAVLGRVKAAMRRGGIPKEKIDEYLNEATSGDYDHLLFTTMKWVDVE